MAMVPFKKSRSASAYKVKNDRQPTRVPGSKFPKPKSEPHTNAAQAIGRNNAPRVPGPDHATIEQIVTQSTPRMPTSVRGRKI